MNYQKIYDDLIERSKERSVPNCYTERHHIVPKSLGGTNDKENIAILTAREHFIAHLLLYKIHKTHGMLMAIRAFQMTHNRPESEKVNSKKFARLREDFSKSHSVFMKEYNAVNGNPFLGKKHSIETRKDLSNKAPRRFGESNPFYGKTHSKEALEKIIKGNKLHWENGGHVVKPFTDEHKENISKAKKLFYANNPNKNLGSKRSKAAIDNIRLSYKKRTGSKPILQIDISTGETIKIFDYLCDIRSELGFHTSNISKCLNGKITYAYGYKWKYLEQSN